MPWVAAVRLGRKWLRTLVLLIACACLVACDNDRSQGGGPLQQVLNALMHGSRKAATTPAETLDRLRQLSAQTTAQPAARVESPGVLSEVDRMIAFWTGDFAALERDLGGVLQALERSGAVVAYDELHGIIRVLAHAPGATVVARRWVEVQPGSYMARSVLGHALVAEAQTARGSNFASETSRQQFDEMSRRLRQATAVLAQACALSQRPVLAVSGLVEVEKLEGQGQRAEELAQLGLKLSPHSYALWWRLMDVVAPEWGGSLEAMHAVRAEAERLDAPDGLLRDLSARIELAVQAPEFRANQRSIAPAMQAMAQRYDRAWLWRDYGNALYNAARPDEALEAYARAIAKSGSVDNLGARYWRARLLAGSGRIGDAVPEFEHAARRGHYLSQQWLISAYVYGNAGLPRSIDKARPWCERAALHGNAWGEFCLAGMYYDGLGGYQRDAALALRYFEVAAHKGHAVAQHDYGWMLVQGKGVAADREAGVRWLRAAAAQGSSTARDKLRSLGITPPEGR